MNWSMNGCPRHLPLMLTADKLCFKFYNYMCVNGYIKMYIMLCIFHIIFACNKNLPEIMKTKSKST